MSRNIIISPYKSAGPFEFGKTPAEIKKTEGKALREIKDNLLEKYIEERGGLSLYFDNKKLYAIYIFKDFNVQLNDISIFSDQALERLSIIDTPIMGRDKAYVLFKNLGLCVGGISGKKIPEKYLAIAFSKDALPFYESYINV